MSPITLCTVFINTCLAQFQTFTVQQSLTLESHILSFKIPGPSIPIIPQIFNLIFITLYDSILFRLLGELQDFPLESGIFSELGLDWCYPPFPRWLLELLKHDVKSVAFRHDMVDSTEPLPMSVFWLAFQYAIFGLADMFTLKGLLDFHYAEASAGMKSMGTASLWCSMALGFFTSSVVVEVVN